MNDNFYEVSDDTINDFYDVFNKKTFPINIEMLFIGCKKQKQLIKIAKIADDYAFVVKKELKVTINESLMDAFDEESRTILIEQEIDKINMNLDTGKIKLVRTDFNTFSGLVNKYGVEKVSRANQVESLFVEQKEDADMDNEFIA